MYDLKAVQFIRDYVFLQKFFNIPITSINLSSLSNIRIIEYDKNDLSKYIKDFSKNNKEEENITKAFNYAGAYKNN